MAMMLLVVVFGICVKIKNSGDLPEIFVLLNKGTISFS
jgi:hypothetical protein